MLQPKKVKYRKMQKGRIRGKAKRGYTVSFGSYGLKALEHGQLTNRQIESMRVAVMRHLNRAGKFWLRVFPDKPLTKKPAETRMGKGKGAPESWVAPVRRGKIICELDGVSEELAKEAFWLAARKLSIKTKFVKRFEMGD
jgi:large subunit ribosomal protein L16